MNFDTTAFDTLLRNARAGQTTALGELLETFRPYLSLLTRLQLDDRLRVKLNNSDVVQDVFVRAKHGVDQFQGSTEKQWLAWLRKILATQLVDHIRYFNAQRRNIDLERHFEAALSRSTMAVEQMVPAEDSTPSQRAEKREQAALLAEALAALPGDYREVIIQRHLEHREFSEIAEQMGRSVESVKGLWRRAMKQLRSELP